MRNAPASGRFTFKSNYFNIYENKQKLIFLIFSNQMIEAIGLILDVIPAVYYDLAAFRQHSTILISELFSIRPTRGYDLEVGALPTPWSNL